MINLLYTPDGWLNFDYIGSRPAWLIIILGARQVGKTYGCLQYMLKNNIYHILLRRTTAELETISAAPDLNPYKIFEPDYHTALFKQAKKLCRICDYTTDEEGKATPTDQRGIATSLAEIAHIRGFNGSAFTDLILDEAIPEKGVITRATEGEAFLNAYTTINGNRELSGKMPLRAWLLANTNRIDSPIMEALGVVDDILYMRRKHKEEMLTKNGVYIVQPLSTVIIEQRTQTAMMKQVSSNSDFYGMAIENNFSYDASPYIRNRSIKRMKPVWSYNDEIYCWGDENSFYICRAKFKKGGLSYTGSRTDRKCLCMDWISMKPYYYAGMIQFSDLRALSIFKILFEIK